MAESKTTEPRLQISLVDCTRVICVEVAAGATQKDVALTYAMSMVSEARGMDDPDWKAINGAILSRWKMSGLERIKKRAHDIVSGRIKP